MSQAEVVYYSHIARHFRESAIHKPQAHSMDHNKEISRRHRSENSRISLPPPWIGAENITSGPAGFRRVDGIQDREAMILVGMNTLNN
jgi:hypothetical protein